MKDIFFRVAAALLFIGLTSGQALAQSELSEGAAADADAAVEAPVAVEPAPPAVEKKSGWYGDQLLYVYGGSLAACVVGALGSNKLNDGDLLVSSLCSLGVIGVVSGGFIVHGANGYWGKAWTSLGMSVGFPVAGLLLGAASGEGFGALAGAILGFMGGGLITPIIDVGWRTYHPEDEVGSMSTFGGRDASVYGLKFTFTLD
jgi:hypothetical protein